VSDPQAVFYKLESIRRETLQRLAPLTQTQLDWKPIPGADIPEEQWSLGEVFMHLAIDEIYLRELIAIPLMEGIKPPEEVRFLPPSPPFGYSKDVIFFWFDRARQGTRRLLKSWPSVAELGLVHEGGLRSMNALEWLESYGSHEAFHHRQIDQLVAMLV
jgi:hypothetical protein